MSTPTSHPNPLEAHLISSAQALVHSALESRGRDDVRIFYLHAGLALEHLLKALLCTVHPALIADARHFDSLYHLCRPEGVPRDLAHGLRTIGLRDAYDRSGRVDPKLRQYRDDLDRFSRHRNAVAHLGLSGAYGDRDTVVLLRVVQTVLDRLSVSKSDFFGEFLELAESALEESAQEEAATALALIAAAKKEYGRQYGGDEPSERRVEALYGSTWNDISYWHVECPACGKTALVHGELDVDYDVNVDHREGVILGGRVHALFVPRRLMCRVCRLELGTRGQLETVDLAGPWDAPEELMDAYMDALDAMIDHSDVYAGYYEDTY